MAAYDFAFVEHPHHEAPGSNSFVPAVAGLVIAGRVIKNYDWSVHSLWRKSGNTDFCLF